MGLEPAVQSPAPGGEAIRNADAMNHANEVHGHEVMQMMMESGQTYTRESLRAAIVAKFGEDARFFTCSAEGLTADGIIDFLAERGKFTEAGPGFTTRPDAICQH